MLATERGMRLGWKGTKWHTIKEGDRVNLSRLLFTKQRDYLVKYIDPNLKVQAMHLKGKVIVLHFVPLLPLNEFLRLYILSLVNIYNQIQPKFGFEVVFVGYAGNKLPNSTHETRFKNLFSYMPWTAIPFSDDRSRRYLARKFSISPHITSTDTFSVAIDPTGLVLQCRLDNRFHFYGARGYPFSAKRFECVYSEDIEDKKHPSITKLLTSPERNYVINKDNQVIPLQNLENKVVALYFYEDDPDGTFKDYFTQHIRNVYQQLADKNLDFEIVLIYIYDSLDTILTSEESFRKRLNTMPWLALPYKDPVCKKVMMVAQYRSDFNPPAPPDRRLAIIDPQRKVFEPYGADILHKFGISAYPFTRQRVAELQVERIKELKLDMFFDLNTTFTQKNGSEIQLSQLVGKRIIFLHLESTRYGKFWRRLKARYFLMKGTIDEFEVIHIPVREHIDVATKPWLRQHHLREDFPWLRHPALSCKSKARKLLYKVFNETDGLVAFERDGSVVRRTMYPSIDRNNLDFPFYAAGMEKEVLREIVYSHQWD